MPKPFMPPPLIAFTLILVMVVTRFTFPAFLISFPFQRLIAVSAVLFGFAIIIWAALDFAKNRTTKNPMQPDLAKVLVISGPFRYSRNPMYLGMALILCGVVIWSEMALNLVWLGLFIWLIRVYQIGPEERALHEKFGESYAAYCQRVRRWI